MSLFDGLDNALGHEIHGVGHGSGHRLKPFYHGLFQSFKGVSRGGLHRFVSTIPLFLSSVARVDSAM
ncbi:hypothetical protein Pyn_07507 [Prunus yedoensis var. nudiflora]|uniref:Uncharacterized protein n=1 Tax=Prunus yedoensis var. nudiflora TaxID=2094558 RepID=A0A314US50_PRUYE|nr:hypothetical protein Pyn_07507 [Prunus yedoensis var. nudiflora]